MYINIHMYKFRRNLLVAKNPRPPHFHCFVLFRFSCLFLVFFFYIFLHFYRCFCFYLEIRCLLNKIENATTLGRKERIRRMVAAGMEGAAFAGWGLGSRTFPSARSRHTNTNAHWQWNVERNTQINWCQTLTPKKKKKKQRKTTCKKGDNNSAYVAPTHQPKKKKKTTRKKAERRGIKAKQTAHRTQFCTHTNRTSSFFVRPRRLRMLLLLVHLCSCCHIFFLIFFCVCFFFVGPALPRVSFVPVGRPAAHIAAHPTPRHPTNQPPIHSKPSLLHSQKRRTRPQTKKQQQKQQE